MFYVVANFKSNKTSSEVKSWLQAVAPAAQSAGKLTVITAPSFPHLPLFQASAPNFALASQDSSPFPPGSYTGAVSAPQLKDLGVSYAIVGHSERRRYFHETPVEIAGKIAELIAAGITPIVCLREADLTPQFAALKSSFIPQCLFCFEPEDNIGGSVTASPAVINQVLARFKTFAPGSALMYGGSVNSGNVSELLSLNLGGLLVAGASLDPDSFISLLTAVSHAL